MKLTIFAVGHKMPEWISQGCAEYIKRMPRELPLSVVEIKPEARASNGAKTRATLLAAEATRLHAAMPGYQRLVVLDERGEDLNTQQFAQRLDQWMREGGDTAFVIGGADGIDEALKKAAQVRLRLSSLTLPHAMARLILCEQVYRAISVLRNHPYHRAD
ncbi:MAG: 23S rRNA (pseudouridine(1915)-N(3))-methyltransferase RlmH [Pseudomonadota bacterium]